MSDWYNPFSWGQRDPQKYDPNTPDAQAARTFGVGGVNHAYDVKGGQLNTGNYDQDRTQQQQLADSLRLAASGQGPSGAGLAADAQREAANSNAASLTAGARGRSSVGSAMAANNAQSVGNQQAAQNEAIGRANEMATARGQLGGVLGQMGGMDVNVAGKNADLSQQAALANQAAQLGISTQELQARMQQQGYIFGNLDPGSPGYGAQMMTALGTAAVKGAMMKHGGVAVPAYADGANAVPGVNPFPSSPQYQLMSPGQRRVPYSAADMDPGKQIAMALAAIAGAGLDQYGKNKQNAKDDAKKQADADRLVAILNTASLGSVYPHGGDDGPITSPTQSYAKGGVVRGPTPALVGEDGPEAIISPDQIVDRPTLTTLGRTPQAVIPLSSGRQDDRDRVINLALALRGRR